MERCSVDTPLSGQGLGARDQWKSSVRWERPRWDRESPGSLFGKEAEEPTFSLLFLTNRPGYV